MRTNPYLVSVPLEITKELANKKIGPLNTILKASLMAPIEMPLSKVLEAIADMADEIVGFDRCLIYLWDEETSQLSVTCERGFDQGLPDSFIDGNLFSNWTSEYGQPILIRGTEELDVYTNLALAKASSLLSLPIYQNARVKGAIQLFKRQKDGFSSEDCILLNLLLIQFEGFFSMYLKAPPLDLIGVIDPVTGLHISSFFEDQIKKEFERVERQNTCLSMLKIEIESFDAYLQALETQKARSALREAADILIKAGREIDLFSYYGQGIFGALLPGADYTGAFVVAKRIQRALEALRLTGPDDFGNVPISVFIGLSGFPFDAKTPENLIRTTDLALDWAKKIPAHRICQFSEIPSQAKTISMQENGGIDLEKLNKAANTIFSVDRLLNLILKIAMESLKAERGSLMIRDTVSLDWILKVARGFDIETGTIDTTRLKDPGDVSSWMVLNKQPVVSESVEEFLGGGRKGHSHYKGKSFLSVPLLEGDEVYGLIHVSEKADKSSFTKNDLELFIPLVQHIDGFVKEGMHFEEVQKDFVQKAFGNLVNIIEFRSPCFKNHSMRVSELARSLGREIPIPQNETDCLYLASLYHDIGYIAVDEAIRNKSGKLDQEEIRITHQHPHLGYKILRTIPFLRQAGRVVLGHHENYDGSGYPKGMAGEDIPILSRILCVADAYDAMTSPRPHRQALSRIEALGELRASSGLQFDPGIISTLEKVIQ